MQENQRCRGPAEAVCPHIHHPSFYPSSSFPLSIILPSIHPSFIHLPILSSIHPSFCPSIQPTIIHPSMQPISTHPSINPPTHPSVHPCVHPGTAVSSVPQGCDYDNKVSNMSTSSWAQPVKLLSWDALNYPETLERNASDTDLQRPAHGLIPYFYDSSCGNSPNIYTGVHRAGHRLQIPSVCLLLCLKQTQQLSVCVCNPHLEVQDFSITHLWFISGITICWN